MSKYGDIRAMERKIRSSMTYSEWVKRNKAAACLCCGSSSGLELHHVVELNHVLLGLWKLYGNNDDSLNHALAMHQDDRVESVTLCGKCHGKRHPGRSARKFDASVRISNWTAMPRNAPLPFSHSASTRTDSSLGLIGFQTLLALGWHVLNGHMDSRIVEVNRRRLAEIMGKTPGTSFNRSLDEALESLLRLGFLIGHHRKGNDVEMHLSPEYVKSLGENPWFVPLDDTRTSNMCVATLKWLLGTQKGRKTYRIGLGKLKARLGMTVRNNSMAVKALRKACAKIGWAKMEFEKGMCSFALARKGAVPIFSLRQVLADSLEQGR